MCYFDAMYNKKNPRQNAEGQKTHEGTYPCDQNDRKTKVDLFNVVRNYFASTIVVVISVVPDPKSM